MTFEEIKESIKLFLYDKRNAITNVMRMIIFVASILAIGSLVYFYGFPQDKNTEFYVFQIIRLSFALYVFNYVLHFVFEFCKLEYLRRTWFEGLIMLILVLEGLTDVITGHLLFPSIFRQLGIENVESVYTFFIQFYFLSVVLVEVGSSTDNFPQIKLHPSFMFMLSLLLIITVGAGLLMLPEMTTIEGGMNVIDAFFTSTSATCVTGLIVEDTHTFFTFKGQMVILILVKLGGLNIISFGSFMALASKFGIGIKENNGMEDFLNKESSLSAKGMMSRVIRWSIMIELSGALLMYFSWDDSVHFKTIGDRIFCSVFHSVSAFNNAGLSLFTDGLHHESVRYNYAIHCIVAALIFFGALGFLSIFDIFSWDKMKKRMKTRWKHLDFSTKIALYFSLILVGIGAVFFFFLENNNTLGSHNLFGDIVTSLFHSITTRTAGFNTIDIGAIGTPMLIIMIFLMFVGASSSSTGGGIKTSTFAILCSTAWATIRGKKHIELFERNISQDLMLRAFSIFIFFIVGNIVAVFFLSITEFEILAQTNRSIMDLIFEQVSAFSTVGLSTGITSSLTSWGRVIIILSMFVGKTGTLTVVFALKSKVTTDYKYPPGHTMVG